jgi:GT2 family glycosyltransferase
MAFRRDSFLKYGLFKEWLGVNSPGLSAEDAEFALRLLVNKQKILSAKDVVVYHNKWLSHKELSKQMKLYICGELSCYGYFAIKGYKFAKKVCLDDFNNVFSRLKKSIKRIYLLKTGGVSLFKNTLFEFTFMIRGLAVAYYFNCRERQQIQ